MKFQLQQDEPQLIQLDEVRYLKQQILDVTKSLSVIREQHRMFEKNRQKAENLIETAIK